MRSGFERRRDRILPYLQRLYGYARFLTRDPEQAEELVQDASLKVLAASRPPESEPAYRSWLFRIVRNVFIDRFRYRRLRDAVELGHAGIDELTAEYTISDDRLIDTLAVRAALEKLKPSHIEILALVDVAGLSYRETADVLAVPVGTVMSRVSRARAALIAALEDRGGRVVSLSEQRKKRG